MTEGLALGVDSLAVPTHHDGRPPLKRQDIVVRNLIGQHLDIEAARVTDEAALRDDLGADSLDAFELLMAFEETFGIEIPDDELDRMVRVRDVIAYLDAHAGRPDGRPAH